MEDENIIENEEIIESDDEESENENLDKKQTKKIKKSLQFAENEESGGEEDDDDDNEEEDNQNGDDFDDEEEDDDDDDDDDFEDENEEKQKKKENMENEKNTFQMELSDDDSDINEEDIDEDENYLQKFNENMKKKIIDEYHPELFSHNYKEVEMLSTVLRDTDGFIIDPLHKTMPFVTKYEKARIIGERAKQIDSGAIPFIEVEDNIIDGYLIALKEYEQKKIPFIIRRPLPDGTSEYWKLKDLEILE